MNTMRKGFSPWVVGAVTVLILGRGFLLHSEDIFGYHDSTQAGRVYDFVLNITHGHIPPRIAPTFSYGMGYPIFNHYAPTAYWMTSAIHFAGATIPYALKVSFFMALMLAGVSAFLLSRRFMSDNAATLAGFLYTASPLMAIEIFVRGNLAELWFLALLPLVLYMVHKVEERGWRWAAGLSLIFALMLMSHNALSIVGGIIVLVYSFVGIGRGGRLGGVRAWFMEVGWPLMLGGGVASSFLVPAVLELHNTHAAAIATMTQYGDHFVCIRQLWDSPWGFGGSMPGCVDGMSFELGKVLIVMGLVGLASWAWMIIRSRQLTMDSAFQRTVMLAIVLGISIFLSLPQSAFVWESGEPVLELFQFPWRFLGIALLPMAFFAGRAVDSVRDQRLQVIISALVCIVVLGMHARHFQPNPDKRWREQDFVSQFMSQDYLRNDIAYRVPEYIPVSVSRDAWMQLQNEPLKPTSEPIIATDGELYTVIDEDPFSTTIGTSSREIIVSKHAAPYVSVTVNDVPQEPTEIDELGRPRYVLESEKSIIDISYVLTPVQRAANILALISALLILVPYIRSWKKNS